MQNPEGLTQTGGVILHLPHEPEAAAWMASSTGAAVCRACILSASAAAASIRASSLCRSPGWNRHALTKDLHALKRHCELIPYVCI